MPVKASIIIGFYKRYDQLALIIKALENQTDQAFEVIIADDGSPKEVIMEINSIIAESPLPIQHIWHEDKGFRKTTILNQAVLASRGKLSIFIDGDCLPGHHFIEDHLKYAAAKRVTVGRRVELSDALSKKIDVDFINNGGLNSLQLTALLNSFSGNTRKAEAGFRLGNKWLNELLGSRKKGILGCNFSIMKADLLALNGFDERYKYPGVGEDTELKERVRHAGFEIFKPKFALVQYHLWHKKQSRAQEKENMKLLQETITNKYIKTPYGINSKSLL